MVFYEIILIPLVEELRAADPGLLYPFYKENAVFDGSEQCSSQLLKLLMNRGLVWEYFPEPAKSLFISDTLGQEEAGKRGFVVEGLALNFVSGGRYLGAYLGPQEELEAWMKDQVEA